MIRRKVARIILAGFLAFHAWPLLAKDATLTQSASAVQSGVPGNTPAVASAPLAQSTPPGNASASAAAASSPAEQPSTASIDCTKQEDQGDSKRCQKVPGRARFIAGLAAIVALLFLVGPLISFKFMDYLKGMDGRYSKSKFQMALWFFVLIWSYLTYTFVRIWLLGLDYVGGIGITENLLLLSGLSALTYGGAKAITTGKTQEAEAKNAANTATNAAAIAAGGAALPQLPVKDAGGAASSFPKDLVTDDNAKPDFGDLQMIIIVLLAVCVYIVHVVAGLDYIPITPIMKLPDVDSTLLGVFGVGQGAYLIKKFAGSPGSS